MLDSSSKVICSAFIFFLGRQLPANCVHQRSTFIRRTQTRNRSYGETYVTYRLVHSVCVGSSVKQSTLLNLGSHFDLPQDQWAALAARIDQLVHGQGTFGRVNPV
jgi:hypothetical protein